MGLHRALLVGAAVVAAMSGGCAASYENRMSFLDTMAKAGIEYREQLRQLATPVSEAACSIGYDLLKAVPPADMDGGGGASRDWSSQVKEAYLKSCLTGKAIPKPDPQGVKAVSPSPYPSLKPSAPPQVP